MQWCFDLIAPRCRAVRSQASLEFDQKAIASIPPAGPK